MSGGDVGGGKKNPLLVRGSHETLGEYYWAVEEVSDTQTDKKQHLHTLRKLITHTIILK